ncbi:hypothetical protein [Marinobacterium stanieri]|uniref:Uncharacterized protein n=1 Tax=Marinobacterium stanieri TaxID=49186 RepID=A0A1N6RQ86_9GAMM|nr:hypothetical protein [Marinobacterium stanieri]SIQ31038.1 hypothetical protein SAMN05421647_103465 [Marinobacterium stanieri]
MPLPENIAAIFPYPASWTDSITEGREYKTDIMRSRDGKEQRRALRSKPRKSLSFDVLLEGTEASNFDYLMTGLQPHRWLLPMWQRPRRLTTAVSAGGNTLQFAAPVSYELRSGDYLVLHREGAEPEAQQVDTVSGDRLSVTLTDVLEADWPAHSHVYPTEAAQLHKGNSGRYITSGVLRANMNFNCLVDARAPVEPELTFDLMIGALEVLTHPINWVNSLDVGYDWEPVLIDADIGPTAYETDGDLASQTRKCEVLTETSDEVDWWFAFFDRCRGRQVPFLMPTWVDLGLEAPASPGATFEVPGTALGLYLLDNPTYTHLMLRLHSGNQAYYEIQAVAPDFELGVTVITTAESWGEAYNPWECVQACLVNTCRLASDRMEISWVTDEVAKITFAVKTVEDVV